MEKAIELLDKFLDQINLGRALIYTSAGFLLLCPLAMLGHSLLTPGPEKTLKLQVEKDLAFVVDKLTLFLIASYVLGLLLVTGSYPMISRWQDKYSQEDQDCDLNTYFTLLTKKTDGGREPLGWLITEYFRFVEATVYLPRGVLGFFFLLSLYFVAQIGTYGPCAFKYALGFMTVFLICYGIYVCFWEERVIGPTIKAYVKAKQALIKGLTEQEWQRVLTGLKAKGVRDA